MSSSKKNDEEEKPSLSLILERLQDALFEEATVVMPKFDDEEDNNVNNQWNVKITQDGRNFREEIEKFENTYLNVFDIDDDEEYTFEMSKIHKKFQEIIENEIIHILEEDFSLTLIK